MYTERSGARVRWAILCVLGMGWICCQAHGIRVAGTSGGRARADQKPVAAATFAMGSFWRGEAVFGCLPGVLRTRVGYCGGTKIGPDYHGVGDHAESLQVEYDPSTIRYEQLLDVFWSHHDPSQIFGQGPDVGEQYRSIIFTQDDKESVLADLSKQREQSKLGKQTVVTTALQPLSTFYQAEAEHQKFELRRKISLLRLLGDLSDDELVTSTITTKLNSYAGGFCPKSVHKLIDSNVSPLLKSRPKLLRLFEE